MKKFTICVAILIIFCSSVFASDNNDESVELDPKGWWAALWDGVYPTYDLYMRSVLLGDGLNAGGGFSIGAETDLFRFEVYAQGDYFLSPLGASSGALALMEFDIEGGITLG